VFKFSDVKSLLVVGGDESVILSADGVVDVVFSDVDRVDGVVGEQAVFDFDLYVKSLGRSIGGAVDPASADGDGDGMRTGRDGRDNIPVVKKPKKGRQRLLNADDRPPSAPTDPMPGESRDARGFDADPEEESYWKRRNANRGVDRDARNVGGNEGVDESARLREQDRVRGENEARLKRDNEIGSLQARVVADTEELNRGLSRRVSPEATEKITNTIKENRKRLSELLLEREEANKRKEKLSKDALSDAVTASEDDLDWFPYSHPIEGFDGVLDYSEKGEALRDPKGGLTAAGRRHFRQTEGSRLLPGVRGATNTPTKMRRKGSFLTRFFTNPSGPMKDEKGKPTRLALSAAAWGEPVPQNMEDAAELAAKGRRLLERYANSKKKSADGDNL
jgi:hypothetical protein